MKIYTTIISIILFALSLGLDAQKLEINPKPQYQNWGRQLSEKPSSFRIIGGFTADKSAIKLLNKLKQSKKGFPIYIGESGDVTVRKYKKKVPKVKEGYYLEISKNRIVIVGNDERGTFYGVQTLLQILSQNELYTVEIKDYPDVEARGVVEGFYGKPWSFQDRINQLNFYGENKINTYIYGPKDDPYHSSPNWRKPYPTKEAGYIKRMTEVAKDNKVDFVWAIHPGKDIKWNQEDRTNIINKFEAMYDLGVRNYAVFFDDISGEGTNPNKQAELLNYIHSNFILKKNDVGALIMCPTEYNKSWSNISRGYLPTLGEKLHQDIRIMWTGDRVVADIYKTSLEWVNKYIKRNAYIWWNYPVTDYVRNHLLMGAVYGNDTDIKDMVSGFMSNPMERAEASKVAIYSVADYSWNMEEYEPNKSWTRALNYVMPEDTDAFEMFAKHNSDLGKNGHGYRRLESVEFKPIADEFLGKIKKGEYDKSLADRVKQEFSDIRKAGDILLLSSGNERLSIEIKPWYEMFSLLGQSGEWLTEMCNAYFTDNTEVFISAYNRIRVIRENMYDIDMQYNQNPYQPGIKTGTLVLAPFVNQVFKIIVDKYNAKSGTSLKTDADFNPHSIFTNIKDMDVQPLSLKSKKLNISPKLEFFDISSNEYIGIKLNEPMKLNRILINFGGNIDWAKLQVSLDGVNYMDLQMSKDKNNFVARYGAKIRYVRFINTSSSIRAVKLNLFEVVF